MSKVTIGIDLGTTNSCAAYILDGKPKIVPGRHGSAIVPSIVTYDDKGNVIVGAQAKRRFLTNPENTIYGAKRLMGRRFGSREMDDIQSQFFYQIEEGDNAQPVIAVGEQRYDLEEISAAILTEVKETAEEHLEQKVEDVVISVPAYFGNPQREAVRRAGDHAGLNVIRIVNEPTAAALAYGFSKRTDQVILIYDLGGGTFDVTVMKLYEEVYEVVGTGGDSFLGGIDFDNRLVDLIVNNFKDAEGIDLSEDMVALQRIRDASERLKIDLSSAERATVSLPFIAMRDGQPVNLQQEVERSTYQKITKDLIDKTLRISEKVLLEANIDKDDIDDVILVGGMTRMPLVHDAVTGYFGRTPRKDVHPDEVVAIGAAILADAIGSGRSAVTLHDVLPVSIGLGVGRDQFKKIINKNTPVPVTKSQLFRTTQDNQKGVKLRIFQGESKFLANNNHLGDLVLAGFPPKPKGQVQVDVRFTINEDGLLSVAAVETGTGKKIATSFRTDVVQRETYRADQVLGDGTQDKIAASGGQGADVEGAAEGDPKKDGFWVKLRTRLGF